MSRNSEAFTDYLAGEDGALIEIKEDLQKQKPRGEGKSFLRRQRSFTRLFIELTASLKYVLDLHAGHMPECSGDAVAHGCTAPCQAAQEAYFGAVGCLKEMNHKSLRNPPKMESLMKSPSRYGHGPMTVPS